MEKVIDIQLEGYNSKNIDLFCSAFSEDVIIYDFPNIPIITGKSQLREVYQKRFETSKNLHCKIINRMVVDNKIIDHEIVSGIFDNNLELVVLFTIEDSLIKTTHYIIKKGYPTN